VRFTIAARSVTLLAPWWSFGFVEKDVEARFEKPSFRHSGNEIGSVVTMATASMRVRTSGFRASPFASVAGRYRRSGAM